MSLATSLARVTELQALLAPPAPAPSVTPPVTGASFAGALQGAIAGGPAAGPAPVQGGTPAGRALLAAAQGEVGVAEQPPGSNDSPRIAEYRRAVAGSGVGPWCAYFVSWAARQAGAPIGDRGEGFGLVDSVYAWAQKTGRAVPAGPGVRPQPGDLIVWDEHIGIVEAVRPDGSIQTVEGNSSDQVARRVHGPDGNGALGYVRIG